MNDIVIFKSEAQQVEVRLEGGIWVAQKKLKAWLPLAQKKRTDFPRKNRWRAGDSAWLRDEDALVQQTTAHYLSYGIIAFCPRLSKTITAPPPPSAGRAGTKASTSSRCMSQLFTNCFSTGSWFLELRPLP